MNRAITLLALTLLDIPAVVGSPDWLVDPAPFRAVVREDPTRRELVLSNGLARRVIRLAPAAATGAIEELTTGEHLLRAVGPEARIELGGKPFPVGGMSGQPVKNYLKDAWLAGMKPDPAAYRFVSWSDGPIEARLVWQRHPEWLSRELPWPPPGRRVCMTYAPSETHRRRTVAEFGRLAVACA